MDDNSEERNEQPADATVADETTVQLPAAAQPGAEQPTVPYGASVVPQSWTPPVSSSSWPPPFSTPDPEPTVETAPFAGTTPAYGLPPVSARSTPAYGQPSLDPGAPGAGAPGAGGPGAVGPGAGGPAAGGPGFGAPGFGVPGAGGPSWPPPSYGYPGGSWYGPPPAPPEPPRRSRRGVALLLVGALVAGGVGAGLGAAFAPGANSNNALQSPLGSTTPTTVPAGGSSGALSTAVITRLVSPSVVDINTVVATESGQPQQEAAGTGMIVNSNGTILTNNHVVEDAEKISVVIGGRSYPATVLGTAKTSDVALLKVTGVSGLPTVSLGDSSAVQVGDPVVALGNALGLGGSPSSAPGYISKTNSTITANSEGITAESEVLHGLFETNAQIQPGDSGGPLVNSRGQVIGMDTAAASSDSGSSVGFAIPIGTARGIALKIENHVATGGVVIGLSPYLGIFYPPAGSSASSPDNLGGGFEFGSGTATCTNGSNGTGSAPSGITLEGVAAGGPAANAGLAAGDVLTSIAGHATPNSNALINSVSGLRPGQQVAVAYTDSCGTAHTTSLTLAGIPA